jgi:hypothetical protein
MTHTTMINYMIDENAYIRTLDGEYICAKANFGDLDLNDPNNGDVVRDREEEAENHVVTNVLKLGWSKYRAFYVRWQDGSCYARSE